MTGSKAPPALLEGDVVQFPLKRRVHPHGIDFEPVRRYLEHACRTDLVHDWKACGVKLADLMPKPADADGQRSWNDQRAEAEALVDHAWKALDLQSLGGHDYAKQLVAGAVNDRWYSGDDYGKVPSHWTKYPPGSNWMTDHMQDMEGRMSPNLRETEQPLAEEAPPGMEYWIKHRKAEFKDRYGDRWEDVLYATAWRQYRAKKRNKSKKKS